MCDTAPLVRSVTQCVPGHSAERGLHLRNCRERFGPVSPQIEECVMPDALPIEPTAPDFFDDDGVGAENVPDEPYLGHGSATLLVEGIKAIEAAPGSHRRRAELVERAMAEHSLDLDFAEYI